MKTPTREIPLDNSHQSNCPLVNPPSGFPPRKFPPEIFPFMFFNIPTQFFKCFYFFHYCHLYRRHYLEDCVVVLYFKSAEVKLVVAYKKIFLLAAQNGYISRKVLLVKYDNSHYYNPPVSFECFYLWSFSWGMWCYSTQLFNQLNLNSSFSIGLLINWLIC